jgi:hypothetical protein
MPVGRFPMSVAVRSCAGEPATGNGYACAPVKRTWRWRHVRVFILLCAPLAFVLATAACFWGRRRVDEPRPVKPYAPVWIWSGGRVEKWHAVVITQDSVSGISWGKSLKCDSCRRSMPRTQVDSMKVGYHTIAERVAYLGGLVILSGFAGR